MEEISILLVRERPELLPWLLFWLEPKELGEDVVDSKFWSAPETVMPTLIGLGQSNLGIHWWQGENEVSVEE